MTARKTITEQEEFNYSRQKDDIRNASEQAKSIVAEAAGLAVKAVADAASSAVKALSVKNADDHDLLIELKVGNQFIREDIKDLRNSISLRLDDHEVRIKKLEGTKNSQTVWITIGTSLIGVLVAIMMFHILKQ